MKVRRIKMNKEIALNEKITREVFDEPHIQVSDVKQKIQEAQREINQELKNMGNADIHDSFITIEKINKIFSEKFGKLAEVGK